jgi:hypothetical protein
MLCSLFESAELRRRRRQLPADYDRLLRLKVRIRAAQVRLAFAGGHRADHALWVDRPRDFLPLRGTAVGGKIVDRLSRELQGEFPGEGFSPRNFRYMWKLLRLSL